MLQTIIYSIVTAVAVSLITTLGIGFYVFKKEEHFKIKVEAYVKALDVVNKNTLAQDIKIDEEKLYAGSTCGNAPTDEEKNNIYAKLALVSKDEEIPKKYLELMTDTKGKNPIMLRDEFIDIMRKDLGFGKVDLQGINKGDSFIIDSKCIRK